MSDLELQHRHDELEKQVKELKKENRVLQNKDDEHERRLDSIERMIEQMEKTMKESTEELRILNSTLNRFNFDKAWLIGASTVVGFIFIGLPVALVTYVNLYKMIFGE